MSCDCRASSRADLWLLARELTDKSSCGAVPWSSELLRASFGGEPALEPFGVSFGDPIRLLPLLLNISLSPILADGFFWCCSERNTPFFEATLVPILVWIRPFPSSMSVRQSCRPKSGYRKTAICSRQCITRVSNCPAPSTELSHRRKSIQTK